jgi:hypothetical protein
MFIIRLAIDGFVMQPHRKPMQGVLRRIHHLHQAVRIDESYRIHSALEFAEVAERRADSVAHNARVFGP